MIESVSSKTVVAFTYQVLDEEVSIMEHSDVPMEYIHGFSRIMYPKVEQAIEGRVAGDTVEVVLPDPGTLQ